MNATTNTRQGIVTKKNIGNYTVQAADDLRVCSISTRLRRELIYPTADPNSRRHVVLGVKELSVLDPVAVGDVVRYVDAGDGSGMIVEVLPRKSRLARRSAVPMPSARPFEQVIVANLDQVAAVFSAADPPPAWNLLDRYLVSAESLNLAALVCITKIDLADGHPDLLAEVALYRKIGYPVLLTSAVSGTGVAELRQALQGRYSVFIGKSGVGKSSLLNALQPGLGLRVSQVSEKTGKGRHTTTHLEMFPLDGGGSVTDTPGMREFGLWDVEEADLAFYFPEMRALLGRCRFGMDCSHRNEPGCAILQAVETGGVSLRRYQSYLRLAEG